MSNIYKSISTKKRIVFSSRFKDGRVRVYFENTNDIADPLYTLPTLSSKSVIRLSGFEIEIYNYPKKDMIMVNKWPKEIFSKVH